MSTTCGCCSGVQVVTPEVIANRSGLDAIAYRVGRYPTFYESMLARLSGLYLDIPLPDGSGMFPRIWPLRDLGTRAPDDYSIALLDAWAVIADVLTFYQERIANEGYLPTATERRSILALADLIGYRLRPGVAASVYLAFTATAGFEGVIPSGTRAQSIPGTGEVAQYFETSDDLTARSAWNLIAPRVTRPQVITPPETEDPAVTAANIIDTVYFDGITTNLKVGDGLVFVFGRDEGQQAFRRIESVDLQSDDSRTLTVLRRPDLDRDTYLEKANVLFPGSSLVEEVAGILKNLIDNIDTGGAAADFIRGTIPAIEERRDIATRRDFTRVAAFLDHLIEELRVEVVHGGSGEGSEAATITFIPSRIDPAPLGRLRAIVDLLAAAPSIQPKNAQRLVRSVAQTFTSESDIAPRLLKVLKPAASSTIYQAWSKVETPVRRLEVLAARVKATLFASTFAGKATISKDGNVSYAAPTISNAWKPLTNGESAPSALPLEGTFDQIKPDSWVAIDRPAIGTEPANQRVVTLHQVVEVTFQTMDTTTGYTAKTTLLTLTPGWLNDKSVSDYLNDKPLLRGTVVYAQTESLDLSEEPLDTDIEGAEIELATAYDGLEAGRWIIVSGNRTDIPDVSGVTASELVMVSGVAQGSRALQAVDFPLSSSPFAKVYYTTYTNAAGDRLVVGQLAGDISALRAALARPTTRDQGYRKQVELAPGVFANAYVPTDDELKGTFAGFAGLLVDPATNVPFPGGIIGGTLNVGAGSIPTPLDKGLFAWRVSSQPFHTILTLANSLAYRYDTRTIKIYGNVVKATQGQTVGEVLGDGDSSQTLQTFALRQSPLTHVSASTPAGTETTLSLRVNEIEWHEVGDLASLGPRDRVFVTSTDDDGTTSATFGSGEHGARLPSGSSNVKALYRYGIGKDGNVSANQISQLSTQPAGVQNVINPLSASGGADADTRDQARRNAPIAVMALDRLVSVQDYADFARNFAGIDKASAVRLTDGRRQVVHVSIAGADDASIDTSSDLYANLVSALRTYGDPFLPVAACARKVKLLIVSAAVQLLPDYSWEAVEPEIRAAMLAAFGFDVRDLGQPAFQSEAVSVMLGVAGVFHVNIECFDSVSEDADAGTLATLASTLEAKTFVDAQLARVDNSADTTASLDVCDRILPAELAYLTPDVADTLILRQIGA